jgi:hypothetical protein
MRRFLNWLLILPLLATASVVADDIPKRFNFDRYQKMTDRSPFAVATAVAAPAATPDFAKDLYVANAAKSSDGDLVTIASMSDKGFKKYLSTREAVDGYSVASIEWSDRVGETKVTISKDGKFATLTFNQALLSDKPAPNMPPPPVAPPGGGQPSGVHPQQTNFPKPAPIPSLPQPRVRGVIPRNPSAENTPGARPVDAPEG